MGHRQRGNGISRPETARGKTGTQGPDRGRRDRPAVHTKRNARRRSDRRSVVGDCGVGSWRSSAALGRPQGRQGGRVARGRAGDRVRGGSAGRCRAVRRLNAIVGAAPTASSLAWQTARESCGSDAVRILIAGGVASYHTWKSAATGRNWILAPARCGVIGANRGQRTCRPVPLGSDAKPRLAEIGVHVSPSRDDWFADLLDKSADEPAATGSVGHRRRDWEHH